MGKERLRISDKAIEIDARCRTSEPAPSSRHQQAEQGRSHSGSNQPLGQANERPRNKSKIRPDPSRCATGWFPASCWPANITDIGKRTRPRRGSPVSRRRRFGFHCPDQPGYDRRAFETLLVLARRADPRAVSYRRPDDVPASVERPKRRWTPLMPISRPATTVYVHCWGGVGRTGIHRRLMAGAALRPGQAAHWTGSWNNGKKIPSRSVAVRPETAEQARYVLDWRLKMPPSLRAATAHPPIE